MCNDEIIINNQDCGCSPVIDPGFSPVGCDDPEYCGEVIASSCVEYAEASLKSPATTNTLYPDVIHYLVNLNATGLDKKLPAILGNYSEQACYILSRYFIKRMLEIIQDDDDLRTLYCQAACNVSC